MGGGGVMGWVIRDPRIIRWGGRGGFLDPRGSVIRGPPTTRGMHNTTDILQCAETTGEPAPEIHKLVDTIQEISLMSTVGVGLLASNCLGLVEGHERTWVTDLVMHGSEVLSAIFLEYFHQRNNNFMPNPLLISLGWQSAHPP